MGEAVNLNLVGACYEYSQPSQPASQPVDMGSFPHCSMSNCPALDALLHGFTVVLSVRVAAVRTHWTFRFQNRFLHPLTGKYLYSSATRIIACPSNSVKGCYDPFRSRGHNRTNTKPRILVTHPRLSTGVVVGAAILGVYIKHVAPGIAGGDAGELVAESCHLGTAHPPGYPLYTMLNHVAVRFLPGVLDSVGLRPGPGVDGRASPAWCANAIASVMGALAATFTAQSTYLLCTRWDGIGGRVQRRKVAQDSSSSSSTAVGHYYYYHSYSWEESHENFKALASGCAAMLMAFSPLMWQYSVTAEVFALNNCLLSLLLSLTLRFSFDRDFTHAAAGALVSGLSLSNQHTSVLYVAPLAGWVMVQLAISRCRSHPARPWRRLAAETSILAALFAVGLVPYAYLPLAGIYAPKPGSWGDVATWSGLLHHLRRGDYGTLRLYSGRAEGGGQSFSDRVFMWFSNLRSAQGLGGIVPAFAVVGMLSSLYMTRRKKVSVLTATTHEEHYPAGPGLPVPLTTSKEAVNGKLSPKRVGHREEKSIAPEAEPSGDTTRDATKESKMLDCPCAGDPRQEGVEISTVTKLFASWDDEGLSAPTALLVALGVYVAIFHWLSNLPLDDPLLFGVHARFWMQPNIIVFVFCGAGIYGTFGSIRYDVGRKQLTPIKRRGKAPDQEAWEGSGVCGTENIAVISTPRGDRRPCVCWPFVCRLRREMLSRVKNMGSHSRQARLTKTPTSLV